MDNGVDGVLENAKALNVISRNVLEIATECIVSSDQESQDGKRLRASVDQEFDDSTNTPPKYVQNFRIQSWNLPVLSFQNYNENCLGIIP